MTSPLSTRRCLTALTVVLIAALPMSADAAGRKRDTNRSVDSVHQPVVSHSAYTYDALVGPGGLTPQEMARLNDWFASIDLGYGDQVAIAADSGYYDPTIRDAVADVAARYGLLVGEDSSGAAGTAPAGSVRLIVRRATARVPSCPDWHDTQETNMTLGGGANFGCGVNSNWAAMVANPEDLVRGQTTDSDLRTATSNRAISAYRDKAPSGAGDLKQITAGGQ